MDIEGDIILRDMEEVDYKLMKKIFTQKVCGRSAQIYTSYLKESMLGIRDTIVAYYQGKLAGYITIMWESNYEGFKEEGIPEVKDMQVLDTYRKKGIATKLMDEVEKRAKQRGDYCAAGVGLAEAYTAAQNLYAQRGYEPDGKGIFYIERELIYDQLEVDDNQALMMIKKL